MRGPEEMQLVRPPSPDGRYQSVTVCQLPLYHLFAMNVTMGPALYGGAKMVMLPKFEPAMFASAIEKYRVRITPLST